jgi:hypothetical protein
MRWFLLVLALAACMPTPASAVTLAEVVALSKGGVSEPVILALIERDQTLFSLSSDQLVKLQREGLSDTILLALLKSGHPSEASLPKDPVALAASQPPGAAPPQPAVVVVGHDPEYPNARSADATVATDVPPVQAPMMVPVLVPVPYLVPHSARRAPRGPGGGYLEHTANPLLCVERVSGGMSPFAPALTRVTECPPQMQQPRNNR